MLTETQEKWLQALESGEFRQTTGVLVKNDNDVLSYCCLGVGAEICGILKKADCSAFIYNQDKTDTVIEIKNELHYGSYQLLGLTNEDGSLKEDAIISNKPYASLVAMNDGGLTFAQIAAYIRANPDNVFVE